MDLKREIEQYYIKVMANVPEDMKAVMQQTAERLEKEAVGVNALKEGDRLPEATLVNAIGEEVNLYSLLEDGPLVISFYRGSWCPYCNLELRAYQDILPEIKALGASLVAISPELPDLSLSLKEKHALEFQVLTDSHNKYAKELGLVFKLDEALDTIYKQFGMDVDVSQGNTDRELPLPATYVVDTSGKIVEACVNTDYTVRLEPAEVLEVLKKIGNK